MKQKLSILLAVVLLLSLFSGCTPGKDGDTLKEDISTDGFLVGESQLEDQIISDNYCVRDGVLYAYTPDQGCLVLKSPVEGGSISEVVNNVLKKLQWSFIHNVGVLNPVFDSKMLFQPSKEGFQIQRLMWDMYGKTYWLSDGDSEITVTEIFYFDSIESYCEKSGKYEWYGIDDLIRLFPAVGETITHPENENLVLSAVSSSARVYYILENYHVYSFKKEWVDDGIPDKTYAFFEENGVWCYITRGTATSERWFLGVEWERVILPEDFLENLEAYSAQ